MSSLSDLVRVRSQQVEALLRACDRAIRQTALVPDLDRFELEIELVFGTRRASLSETVGSATLVVLHGPPGCGKTIALLKAQKRAATELQSVLEARRPIPASARLPVYVNLARAQGAAVPELIAHQLLVSGDPRRVLTRILGQLELMLLVDGLNELPKRFRREALNQLVNLVGALKASGSRQTLRVLLATRTYLLGEELQYLKGEGFVLAEVAPIDGPRAEREIARGLGITRGRAEAMLKTLEPQMRNLLSTAQNLDGVITWCKRQGQLARLVMSSERTRGALLDFCLRARFPDLQDPLTMAAFVMLGRLAYSLPPGETRFPRRAVVKAAREAADSLGLVVHVPLVDLVFELRLLTEVVDEICEFDHHSHQQYFLAREMASASRRSEWARYISEGVWHEPLVLMVGILERKQQAALLKMAEVDRPLYAYLLANADWPDLQRAFLFETVATFHRDLRRVATGLARHLKALTALWIVLLLLSLFAVALAEGGLSAYLTGVIPLVVLVLPFAGVRWYRARLAAGLSRLREVDLPDLLAVNRPFRERGMLKAVLTGLQQMARLQRSQYSPDDPRARFLTDAIAAVEEAIETTIDLSEDEILVRLADPLIAQALDPAHVSERGVEQLEEFAARHSEPALARQRAIRMLGRIWLARTEFRERIEAALAALMADGLQPRIIRREIRHTCREFGMPVEHGRWLSFLRDVMALAAAWVKRLLALRA